ncbi:TetR/AcrR family transcriptional regulator [Intestinibacillus massiliensis]|uniref:TetR/AcrR family transcriptional regulator n=1 Tax=Intestinibacillus massiliensis TaxID=1871029 RepID=UPI000B358511|nr:TetR/AcrR family transcriptional regulator [Intestinibacillus massiliensis]MCB6366062.1 TetR/AcrR family transcriptional regulator [Intestinibacillus massiliensis]
MSTEIRMQRRADILSAAEQEFAERGYERTKMEGIARRAGIGKSTVYEYFPSKNELLTAVLTEGITRMNRNLEAFMRREQAGFRSKLISMLGHAGNMLRGTMGTLMNLRECEPAIAFMRDYGERERDFILTLLETSVRKAIEDGEVREDIQPRFAAALVFALLLTAGNELLFADADEKTLEKTVDYLFEGFGPRVKAT